MSELSSSQKKAVELLSQNVAVRAGAGTGKTRVLVDRFLEILRRGLAKPTEILTITFTDKAANEMKARIVTELKKAGLNEARREIENAYIGTIHAFCSRLLKEHPVEAGIDPDFRVIEEDEANLLKENVLDQLIESRFQDASVFELLAAFSERRVRSGIKDVYEKVRTFGLSFSDAFRPRNLVEETDLKGALVDALQPLLRFDNKKEQAEEAIHFLESDFPCDWSSLQVLEDLSDCFDLRSKQGKQETQKVKEIFQKLILSQIGKLGAPFKSTFQDLVQEFDRRYEKAKTAEACFDFSDLQIRAKALLAGDSPASRSTRARYQKQFKFIMVDEFQDTDQLQLGLIELLQSGQNLFLVGDVKQSIYGFRGTDPTLLEKKEREFENEKAESSITLSENFRSRTELIDFINPFFDALWKGSSLSYDPLCACRSFPDSLARPVDLIEVEKEEDESVDETRSEEARMIAARIEELVRHEHYAYEDFAILFRAGTKMHLYEQELRNFQIPYYVVGGRGFYAQPEIRDLIHFLAILENPLHEIPLVAVLRSPLFHVADDTLFWLSRRAKKEDTHTPFFDGFREFEKIGEISEGEREKLRLFKLLFDKLLANQRNFKVSELLESILKNTRYDLYVLGLPQGKRHFANLKKLVELARELESREAIHVGDFIRYIKGLEAREARESEAQIEAEEGQVVKLLTIHKAKGLEFRAVILPDLARRAAGEDTKFLFDPEFGLGIHVLNPESRKFEREWTYELVSRKSAAAEEEESKRLLYVAMTRAKERLILAGTAKRGREIKKDSALWFDWVRSMIQEKNLKVNRLPSEMADQKKRRRKYAFVEKKQILQKIKTGEKIGSKNIPKEVSQVMAQLETPPPHYFERIDLPVSAYVTFSKDKTHEHYRRVYELGGKEVSSSGAPLDLKSEELSVRDENEIVSAADFGTLVHKVFEHLVTGDSKNEERAREVVQFYAAGYDLKTRDDIFKLARVFLDSKVYSNIQNARRRIAEIPFVLRLSYGIIQGTLDLLYETKTGEWVIVDYKTSELSKSEVRKMGEEYRNQMELYGLACREILGNSPQKAVLYFVKADAVYEILFDAVDFDKLRSKYESQQWEIVQFRKGLINESV